MNVHLLIMLKVGVNPEILEMGQGIHFWYQISLKVLIIRENGKKRILFW